LKFKTQLHEIGKKIPSKKSIKKLSIVILNPDRAILLRFLGFVKGLTGLPDGATINTYTGRGNDESSKLATPQQERTEAPPQAPSIESC
jgi:hypothetical protein